LRTAGDDPVTLANSAFALAHFGEDLGAMMALADRALSINPNFARGWFISGYIRMWAGDLDLAVSHGETALRLSPRGRVGVGFNLIGAALFFSRRFEEAIPKFLLAIRGTTAAANYRISLLATLIWADLTRRARRLLSCVRSRRRSCRT
jgi:tetratricopeptide (TPR) repeat protein